MQTWIAFLRAINVGGRTVKMADLRALFAAQPGFSGVETFIASGNVIFQHPSSDREDLQPLVEAFLQAGLGYPVDTFLRMPNEVAEIANCQPFEADIYESAMAAGGAFNVAFLKSPLDPAALERLAALRNGMDDFVASGSQVYWLCRVKQSQSKFSNAVFERKVQAPATFRGMNMLRRLADQLPRQTAG